MLQNIRERSQGIVAWAIILLVSLTFVLWGVQDYISHLGSNTDRVKVNGIEISAQQIETNYERLRRKQLMQMRSEEALPPEFDAMLKKQALNSLIVNQILTQAAKSNGYVISIKQAEAVVPQIPAFQVDGKFSEQRFMQVLNATLFSPESFLDSLQAELMRNQMSLGISESAFALPIEVDQAVQLIYQKRDMSYAILTLKQFIPQVKITESLIQDFYKANQQEFTIPEQVRLEYLELSLNDLAKAQHISQKEAQQKFADMNEQLANLTFSNPDSLQPAAKALKLTIKQTGFFAENSKQNDKQSMTANPKVIAAAFNPDVLGRKNNSDVIPVSPTDVVVLRIKEHIPAGTRSLNEVRSSIVKRLTEKQAVAMAQLAGEKILKALQSGATQQSIAKEYGLQWQSASQVTRNDMKINSAVVAAAFAAGVPHDKHVKPLKGVPLPQGDYAIVQVSAVYPGSVKNLKSSEATTFRQQLQSTDGVQEYALYVQGLLQNAKIVINGKTTPWRELVNAPAGEASSVVNRDSE